ncbi:apses-domain-containing protein [Hesseltinella vesiculosa]|uniref:Apses-domain-containing protein n=1 Tax=Hesseltinella vesiculosa TaxID=101127 RepID=A0A1X2G4M6_9FUNG|nr:apses-domain-containing protein [Hesseltinella vesiculosa]
MADVTVYQARYSGVAVYEITCNDVAVMRRQADAYMNATQILKVANFDKPQRTRILEREVQTGKHEKIQGGYGKYQGTWVPLERAIELARRYQVETPLQPIFSYERGEEEPPIAPRHTISAHKPKRTPKPTPKRRVNDPAQSDATAQPWPADDTAPASHLDTPTRRPHRRTAGTTATHSTDDDLDESQPSPKRRGRPKRPRHDDSPRASAIASPLVAAHQMDDEVDGYDDDASGWTRTRREIENERMYAHRLLTHFLGNNEDIPVLLRRPPRDLDVNVIIDDEGHTCLHWAAVMGRLPIVMRLIKLGADIYRVNYRGETALMRCVLYSNNYDQKTFDGLADVLKATIFNIDKRDQTVFHHVALTANSRGKVHASRYYMDILISHLAHSRSELISILNVQDINGDTALTIASRFGNKRLVRLLIDAGASTEIANEEGLAAQDYLASMDTSPLAYMNNGAADLDALKREDGLDEEDDVADAAAAALALHEREKQIRQRLMTKAQHIYQAMTSADPSTSRGPSASSTPSVSQWFDDLAGSYERDLLRTEQLIKDRQRIIEGAEQRLLEMRHYLGQETPGDKSKALDNTKEQGDHLVKEYEQLLKYLQYTTLNYAIHHNTTVANSPASPASKEELVQQLKDLQQARQTLVQDILQTNTSIPEKRIRNYKRLISMCCNVSYENVDTMLSPLLASFEPPTSSLGTPSTS